MLHNIIHPSYYDNMTICKRALSFHGHFSSTTFSSSSSGNVFYLSSKSCYVWESGNDWLTQAIDIDTDNLTQAHIVYDKKNT